MSESADRPILRLARFLGSLLPAALLFALFFATVVFVSSRIDGLTGVLVGLVAGGCLAAGVLLAYWTSVDWLNLRHLRRSRGNPTAIRDGEIVAVHGIVRTDGEPLKAPFSGTPCAAYTYVVSYSRTSALRGGLVQEVLAQGFHLTRTRIDGSARSLRLRVLPSFEDDLRVNKTGREWGAQVRDVLDRLAGSAVRAGERERRSQLVAARHSVLDEVHQDYRIGKIGINVDPLVIEEEVLPFGQQVCVIGTYDQETQALTARRSRVGPNVMVYRGSAEEVLARVGKDVGLFSKIATTLIAIGTGIFGVVLLPVMPAAPPTSASPATASVEADPEAEYLAQVDAGVRRAFAAGDRTRAFSLAVDANAADTVRWLLGQGIPPDLPIPQADGWHLIAIVEASRLGHVATVRALLDGGADPNAVEPRHPDAAALRTSLGEALREGHCEVAAMLEDAGARRPAGIVPAPCRPDETYQERSGSI